MSNNNNRYIKVKKSWPLILFGAVFAAPAMVLLFWSIIPGIYESVQMQSWQATSATLTSAKVSLHRSDETTTYKANASYKYSINGKIYTNNRVQISSGSDNIGDFQQKFGNKLELDYLNKRPVTIYYDGNNPADSIIHRELRWELLLFKSIMVAVFGLAGFGILIWGWRGQKINTAPETHSQPWLVETDWMDNQILSDSKSGVYFSAIFAAFWNLISLPLAIFIFPDAYQKEGLMVALIVLLFPAVGLGLLYWAYHNLREWRKFGRSPLQLSPFPGVIGGDVGGEVRFKQRLPEASDYLVTLTLGTSE